MKFPIKSRWTGDAIIEVDLDASLDTASMAARMGAAVNIAIESGACLRYANLRDADLGDANLRDADLRDVDLGDANLAGANLGGANLGGANLHGAYLAGANLRDADLIDGGQRVDGYRFIGWIKDGALWISAGCRDFTMDEARKHWGSTEYRDRALGDEALAILDRIEATARIRAMVEANREEGNNG